MEKADRSNTLIVTVIKNDIRFSGQRDGERDDWKEFAEISYGWKEKHGHSNDGDASFECFLMPNRNCECIGEWAVIKCREYAK